MKHLITDSTGLLYLDGNWNAEVWVFRWVEKKSECILFANYDYAEYFADNNKQAREFLAEHVEKLGLTKLIKPYETGKI
ncbi:hypothetical protein [Dyadobacter sp. CY312]|uniref:hypothetical protein n=1 Tax=Dyadobacter sp. CY312 TaxID=2907303 RepID=UPI001F3D198C|nr:hypothetical protein [Dyadobacter sp. CY312]MCE7039188.1 hypothetical protein [Dyadobacter sp. CY312]